MTSVEATVFFTVFPTIVWLVVGGALLLACMFFNVPVPNLVQAAFYSWFLSVLFFAPFVLGGLVFGPAAVILWAWVYGSIGTPLFFFSAVIFYTAILPTSYAKAVGITIVQIILVGAMFFAATTTVPG